MAGSLPTRKAKVSGTPPSNKKQQAANETSFGATNSVSEGTIALSIVAATKNSPQIAATGILEKTDMGIYRVRLLLPLLLLLQSELLKMVDL